MQRGTSRRSISYRASRKCPFLFPRRILSGEGGGAPFCRRTSKGGEKKVSRADSMANTRGKEWRVAANIRTYKRPRNRAATAIYYSSPQSGASTIPSIDNFFTHDVIYYDAPPTIELQRAPTTPRSNLSTLPQFPGSLSPSRVSGKWLDCAFSEKENRPEN